MAYPVMQVYGSPSLEDNSEVAVLWCWADTVFLASTPGPSSSQSKKQTRSLKWVLLGKEVSISSTGEVRLVGSFFRMTNRERPSDTY